MEWNLLAYRTQRHTSESVAAAAMGSVQGRQAAAAGTHHPPPPQRALLQPRRVAIPLLAPLKLPGELEAPPGKGQGSSAHHLQRGRRGRGAGLAGGGAGGRRRRWLHPTATAAAGGPSDSGTSCAQTIAQPLTAKWSPSSRPGIRAAI